MYRTALPISVVLLAAGLPLTACTNMTTLARPAPTVTVTRLVSQPAPPVSPAPTSPSATHPPVVPAPAVPQPALTNASAVVTQYYQDITDHDYAVAWALGGSNIAGMTYGRWVAGYATTASIDLGTVNAFGASRVTAALYATQTDGTVKVYEGTYTVASGVLVGASIRQVD
ncbi:MAG: hypothetical protein JO362_23010 [Streptomycetaceae bacterium]|nr:hypothetical protein [Streptomycetaceae bacterium]